MANTLGKHTSRFMIALVVALVALVLAAALPAFAGLLQTQGRGDLSADALEELAEAEKEALLAESLATTVPQVDELTLASTDSDADSSEVFQETVGDLAMYFTVTGDDEVAVGRNNDKVTGHTDYAIDAPHRGDVTIPAQVSHNGKTYRVTALQANAFSGGGTSGAIVAADPTNASADPVYSTVTIPASVKSIGNQAFMSCDGLSQVVFEDASQLESIGISAFQRCFALASFQVPASVKSIANQAFAFCTSLESFTFAEDSLIEELGKGVWQCSVMFPGRLTSLEYPAVRAIRESSLTYQVALTSLTFKGSSYQYIGQNACFHCESLTYLEIPELTGSPREEADTDGAGGVMFGSRALADCTSLETIVFLSDADDYVVYSSNTGQQVFYDDTAVSRVVYCGSPWGGNVSSDMNSNGSMLPSVTGDVSFYNRIRFYKSSSDLPAEGEGTPVAEVFLSRDVTPHQINEGVIDPDQVYAFRGVDVDIPKAQIAWHVEGYLDNAPITSSTYAYDAAPSDFASVSVSLEKTSLMQKVDTMALRYTVVAYDGTPLVEGQDYEVSYYESDGETVLESLDSLNDVEFEYDREGNATAKTYVVRFTGKGAYDGFQQANFYLKAADIDNDWYKGDDISSVARLMSREYFADGNEVTDAILVSDADPRYILAAMPVAKAMNATILVTDPQELSTGARAEIKRLDLSNVYIFGGSSIIDDAVKSTASSVTSNVKVTRIFSTATDFGRATAEVLKQASAEKVKVNASKVYVVASDDPSLGAAIAPVAYREAIPVVFAGADGSLDGATRNALKTAGYSTIVVVSETEGAIDKVKAHVGNDSITYESKVGTKAEMLSSLSHLSGATESNQIGVVVAPDATDCASEILLAAWYSGLTGASVEFLDESETGIATLKASFEPYKASISSIRFVATDDHLAKETTEDILKVWLGE